MKINFSDYDFTSFYQKDGLFCGESAILIYPREVGVKFTQQNKIFRSSIWDKNNNLISAGFPKFTNWGENPEEFPVPVSLDNCELISKIDGSLAIFDYHNGQINVRTRGTFSYRTLDNGADFEFVLKKYPRIEEWLKAHPNFSLLCEIVTPNKLIILRYENEPALRLIGCINKNDYALLSQGALDTLSEFLEIPRPEYRVFREIKSLVEEIQSLKGIEGYCCYSENGQTIHKIKTTQYLTLHRAKSYISSFDKVVDLFFEIERPNYEEFYSYLETTFDFELAEHAKDHMRKVCLLYENFTNSLQEIMIEIPRLQAMERKQAAEEVKNQPMKSYIFSLLDNREISVKNIKNWIYKQHEPS